MSTSNISTCTSEKSYKKILYDARSRVVVVHFEADWAEECKQMNDVIEELAKTYKHTLFVKLEAEELADITTSYEVECVPTFIILREAKVLEKIEGANASRLSEVVKHHSTSFVAPIVKPNPEINIEDRLKKLISSSPVMLFMKGSPANPQCGFSKQIIALLNESGIKFSHFDILSDNEVRQGLKKYSDWPTYPQLYGDGELIGGLDIIKELAESGELIETLPKVEDINEKLKKLTSRSPVIVFMKGDPKTPRCKFSKALMAIFNNINFTEFDSFDILQDEEVRQELKTYTNWPTYPQIYVKGEFIGGLDIVKELNESGELLSNLTPS